MTVGNGGRRILMLHGFVQSGNIFSSKTGGLRKSLKKLGYELFYPTAPIRVNKEALAELYGWQGQADKNGPDLASEFDSSASADEIYGWYLRKGPDPNDFDVSQATLDYLHDYVVENGPFDGIIGFSQGAGLAGYLSTDFNRILKLSEEQQPKLKFFVAFSGFKFEAKQFQQAYADGYITTPSLHVEGELDTVVTEERSKKLYECCDETSRHLIKHLGGHFVPNSKNVVMQVSNWIQNSGSGKNKTAVEPEPPKLDGPDLDDDLMSMINSMGKI